MIITISIYLSTLSLSNMKEEAESFVNDIELFSKGLIVAIKDDKFKEAIDYTNKMKELLDRVKTYAEMKKRI
jgi:hypothetical protein